MEMKAHIIVRARTKLFDILNNKTAVINEIAFIFLYLIY